MVELSATYDIILLDLPPFTAAADTLAVSPLLDGVLIAAEWGATPSELFAEVCTALRAQTHILGSVLTKVDLKAASPYGAKSYYGPRERMT